MNSLIELFVYIIARTTWNNMLKNIVQSGPENPISKVILVDL